MTNRTASFLLSAIVSATIAAAGVLVADVPARQRQVERSTEFQRLVGGLTLGRAVSLPSQAAGFGCGLSGECQPCAVPKPARSH